MKDKILKILKEFDCNNSKYAMEEVLSEYMKETYGMYRVMPCKDALVSMLSEQNYRQRHKASGCEALGVWVRPGDICYIDFGLSYLNEAGFQHFGLVLRLINNKAFVIPMTSNEKTYFDSISKNRKAHLMPIGKVKGMNKNSVLFLNDARCINTARIIDVKAHVPIQSNLFKEINERLSDLLFSTTY